ncbi:hypothetical protein IV102_13890 [bacterium]|nr:hypothetical protein [bacterium]
MSRSGTFQGPPESQKNATLYQHAQEVMRFVGEAKGALEKCDNVDQVDLNASPGTVVVDKSQPVLLDYRLSGALDKLSLREIKGEIVNGSVRASLSGPGGADCTVEYQETATQIHYVVGSSPRDRYDYDRDQISQFPGMIRVVKEKSDGALRVEQQREFPWSLGYGPGAVETERRFPATGPADLQDAPVFQRGEELRTGIDRSMARLRGMDNGPQDLNPESGVVVVTAFDVQVSENFADGGLRRYPVPAEALLRFDPKSGQVSEYFQGFGDRETFSYRSQGDSQVYEQQATGACDRLEVNADGSRLQQHFLDTEVGNWPAERTVSSTSLLSRMFDGVDTVGKQVAWGGGMMTAIVAALCTPLTLGVSGGLGLLVAAVSATFANTVAERGVRLGPGVNRFEGNDMESRLANARSAYDHVLLAREMSAYQQLNQSWELGQDGLRRDQCIANLNSLRAGSHGDSLVILVQSLGEKGEPAVVVIPKTHHYPLRTEEQGLLLPDGVTIAYGDIRAMSEWKSTPHGAG